MTVNNEVAAIEMSLWDIEPTLLQSAFIDIQEDDLHLRISKTFSLAGANKVVRSVFTTNPDERIKYVFDLFAAYKRPFTWWVGPKSHPADLCNRLKERGMWSESEYVGMCFDLRSNPPDHTAERWKVEEACTDEQLLGHAYINASLWGGLDSLQEAVEDRKQYMALQDRRGGYLVVKIDDKYVGNASYRYSLDGRVLYLQGGSVLPPYRGKGIYHSLLSYRIAMARDRGCEVAVTIARKDTSAPILARYGFQSRAPYTRLVTAE